MVGEDPIRSNNSAKRGRGRVIRRNAVIGIGFVFLVIGLAGLVLLQTEVIYPPASKGQIGSIEAEPGGSERAGRP